MDYDDTERGNVVLGKSQFFMSVGFVRWYIYQPVQWIISGLEIDRQDFVACLDQSLSQADNVPLPVKR